MKKLTTFQYANECELEIHCSPFGLSGLYIKVIGTNLMGIGSAMGLVTGSTRGLIHYNDCNDFVDQKYKLYVVVDDEGMLRIDFTKIFTLGKEKGEDNIVDEGDSASVKSEERGNEEEILAMIFRGKCPEGRSDNIDPFIGIFSFERED